MAISITIDESRRLTGPNLLSDHTGAVLEVYVDGMAIDDFTQLWREQVTKLLEALALDCELATRQFENGVSLYLRANEDQLYAACEINETAVALACEQLSTNNTSHVTLTNKDADTPINASIEQLKQLLVDEANPKLMALLNAATAHGVTCLVDDDYLSLGMGKHSQTWAIDELPEVAELDWSCYKDIEVALITGTNGKSTSVRMCDAIVKAAGINAGITSTDYIRAGTVILDRGDYSGPLGARTLLRDSRTELALLEVARGGMLRRGLGTNRARAALVTNVADDHLGQFGINTVKALTGVKSMVARALNADGTLVINADDAGLVAYYQEHPELVRGKLCYFSLDASNPLLKDADQAFYLAADNQSLMMRTADAGEQVITSVSAIPTARQGAARHNIANALGAAALCFAMGIEPSAIAKGLSEFKGDNQDNPGRGNFYQVNGVQVIIDFAHNPHSLSAMVEMVKAMPAKRKLIMLGHAGDRTNRDIINLTDVALALEPDAVVTAELPEYLRGRQSGEISNLIKQHLLSKGISDQQIIYADDNFTGAKLALEWAKPGDLLLLLALDQREQIFEHIKKIS